MSNDQQPFDELEKIMAAKPKPSDAAKARAKMAAVQAFVAEQATAAEPNSQITNEPSQGFWARLRQTLINKTHEGSAMQKKWIYSGALASLCVVGLTAVLVKTTQPELLQQAELKRAAQTAATAEQDSAAGYEGAEAEEIAAYDMAMSAPVAEPMPQMSAPPSLRAKSEARADRAQMQESVAGNSVAKPMAYGIIADDIAPPPPAEYVGEDEFTNYDTNPIHKVSEDPVSTFSIDVDTASYSFVRSQLNAGVLPQKDAVRLEEMVNYFDYQYPLPDSKTQPFSTSVVVEDSPWKAGNKLVHIGIKGYELSREQLPKSNLVFLLDVSGSMNESNKLPLVKQSMELLLSQLNPSDTVAIAVYAGAAGTVLPPTPVKEKQTIMQALEKLQAGGSTAGGEGIKLAYQLAESNFDNNAVNRVILATDGDFNVGITDHNELTDFIERKRDSGIYLSVLGFGQGNYHDNLMQDLAQNGNGVAAYIDTLSEAQKVLVHQATSTLFTIAKDVKIQVEFNPATVNEYRLLGFETRMLNREDFNNDKVDAGDIGAGHTVTAIYEISPVGSGSGLIDKSRYQVNKAEKDPSSAPSSEDISGEYGYLKLRYKLPSESESKLIEQPIRSDVTEEDGLLQREVNFSTSVAGFAELLRGGQYTPEWTYDDVIELAQANKGDDPYGYRTEFIQMVRKAKIAKGMP